jgi:molecular chaperone GrpE
MQDPTTSPESQADSKRHGDKLEHAVAAVAGEPADQVRAPGPTSVDPGSDVLELLQKAEAEVAELRDAWLRARAETENARKQAAAEVQKAHRYAVDKFAEDLLAVSDSLQQALATPNSTTEQLRAGVELTLKQLQSAFARAQIVEVDPLGDKFDPHLHQAMQVVESTQPPNTVVQVLQKGYLISDRVLRPALVMVAKS